MSQYGQNLHLTIFGQSHAPAIGMTLEGLPAGESIDMEALQAFLKRRAPGQNAWSTPRKEADAPEFLSGLVENVTCGAPITAVIRNTNTRSGDYANLAVVPRPGHADYTAWVKYGGHADFAGGGAFSGRLTAPLCIAGGICLQLLKKRGIEVISRIASIGTVEDPAPLTASTADKPFPVVDDAAGEAMRAAIAAAKADGDSIGGVVLCWDCLRGWGDPCLTAWRARSPPSSSASPPSRALNSASALLPPGSGAAKITIPSPWKTARSELPPTTAAASWAASPTGCPSPSGPPSSPPPPSPRNSRA